MKKKLVDSIASNAGKILDVAPEVYGDALKPTVKEIGRTASLIPRAINAALVPIEKWIEHRMYSLEETKKLLQIKLENVDNNKIVTPEAYVAVPALQAISYSMDNEELRNMYANLLANAMNVDEKDKVHPAFVEIIKQMTPKEAVILEGIFNSASLPIIDLGLYYDNGLHNRFYNITWITAFAYDEVAVSLDNLVRMGLIEIPYGKMYTDDGNYDVVRVSEAYKNIKNSLAVIGRGEVREEKKYIEITALGKNFYRICLEDNKGKQLGR